MQAGGRGCKRMDLLCPWRALRQQLFWMRTALSKTAWDEASDL